jgi:sulfite dehydrogenase
MRDQYGAAIPEEQIAPLVDYLLKNYGAESTNSPSARLGVSAKPAPQVPLAPAQSDEALATKYGCLGCHSVSTKIVGPAYQLIAAKYRNDAEAPVTLSEQIHKGGSGKWGSIIMPPFPTMSAAETKALADWILSQK